MYCYIAKNNDELQDVRFRIFCDCGTITDKPVCFCMFQRCPKCSKEYWTSIKSTAEEVYKLSEGKEVTFMKP